MLINVRQQLLRGGSSSYGHHHGHRKGRLLGAGCVCGKGLSVPNSDGGEGADGTLWVWMEHMRLLATLTIRAASGPPAVPLPPRLT